MKNHFPILILIIIAACGEKNAAPNNPPHYDLGNFTKYEMPDVLREISGIAFSELNEDTIYAEQDNEGKIFHFKLGDKQIISSKFGKKGDYEDISIYKGIVIMLRSDGVLYTFPLSAANPGGSAETLEWDAILPPGEYEGMYVNQQTGLIYVLCKQCSGDRSNMQTSGYLFNVTEAGNITAAGNFTLDISAIENLSKKKKLKFHPSAISYNKKTSEWYILSSVNGLLVIADEKWKIKQAIPLNRSDFVQPEGITFDRQGNMYISNEAGLSSPGNILKFNYQN